MYIYISLIPKKILWFHCRINTITSNYWLRHISLNFDESVCLTLEIISYQVISSQLDHIQQLTCLCVAQLQQQVKKYGFCKAKSFNNFNKIISFQMTSSQLDHHPFTNHAIYNSTSTVKNLYSLNYWPLTRFKMFTIKTILSNSLILWHHSDSDEWQYFPYKTKDNFRKYTNLKDRAVK